MINRARAIAFYLPQFHAIPENDEWYGDGFTEWTNVRHAKRLFSGHFQPRQPAELGYYDLTLPEIREAQAALARRYGVEAFCYWHYWFGNGRRILERPFEEVLRSGQPDFRFCLAWANASWRGVMYGKPEEILIQQLYPGERDFEAHFYAVLPAFRDRRYIEVKGEKLFVVFDPSDLPDAAAFVRQWQALARKEGLFGLHLVGAVFGDRRTPHNAFDGSIQLGPFGRVAGRWARESDFWVEVAGEDIGRSPLRSEYRDLVEHLKQRPLQPGEYPNVMPGWDNTPRAKEQGSVLTNSTPALFGEMVRNAVDKLDTVPDPERRLLFIQAWNEWGEGNYLEPDTRFGRGYLRALRRSIVVAR